MERITYRITLDTHKNGIQRTLQGFLVGDKMSRRIAINLMAGGDTFEIPFDHVTAVMYVLRPTDSTPSINACTIEDNTIIYDVLPSDLALEGITEMQLKLIEGNVEGARKVLISPRFALEITEGTYDEGVVQTASFTALEKAVAQAKAVYDTRLLSVEVTEECTFKAYYADGTVYENDYMRDALYNGNALLSESFAHGNTGIRAGEDSDNAMYYKNMAEGVLEQSLGVNVDCHAILDEVISKSLYTSFSVDFVEGKLTYFSQNYNFTINPETGELEFEGTGEWIPPDENKEALNQLLAEVSQLKNRVETLEGTS